MLVAIKHGVRMRPVLITAGATRNRIDAMRFISAHSSGRTGAHIAEALNPHRVLLLGSPEACLRASERVQTAAYGDTMDLMQMMKDWISLHPDGIVVHASAVGDYMADPSDASSQGKLPSGQPELSLRLVPTPKILDQLKDWSADIFLASFKAAPPHTDAAGLEQLARAQATRTSSDLVFANTIGQLTTEVVVLDQERAVTHSTRDGAIDHLIQRISSMR